MSTKSLVVILAISGLVLLGSVFVSSFSVNQPLLGGTILFPTGGGTGSSTLSGIIMGNGTGAVNSVTIGTGLSLTGTTLISTASGNWATSTQNYYESQLGTWKVVSASFLTPTTTLGVLVGASSTIGNGTTAGGLTINGGATTTLTALFQSPVGINCAPNKGAYGGSGIFTICGDASNAAILELSRPISSGASNIFSIAFGDTSNSVLGQINGRSDTSGSTGKLQFLTSNGSNDLQALTIDSSQNAAFSNSGTSTFSKGLEVGAPIAATYFIATSTATSTAANGWNLTGGCFAINGTCVGGSGGSGTVTNVAVDSTLIGGPITTTGTLGINLNNANRWNNFLNVAETTGWYMLGSSTLAYASSTNSTTVFGLGAGGNVATTTGSVNYETAIGWQALSLQTTGNGNTAVGAFALNRASTSPQNTAVGVGALWGSGSATFSSLGQNTAMGYFALASTTSGNLNTAFGYNAGKSLTSGQNNVFIGGNTGGANAFTGSSNTLVGQNAGVNAFSESNNTFVGYAAGSSVFNGGSASGNNIFLGANAGAGGSSGAKQFNTILGGSAGNVLGVAANDNTLVGYKAGVLQTTGTNNVLIGSLAGQFLTTGSNDILIGYNANATSTTQNNFLNIGGLLFANLPATTSASTLQSPTTGAFGIATSTPWAEFSISANNGMAFPGNNLFVIASSTATATTTLFSVNNSGTATALNYVSNSQSATSTFANAVTISGPNSYLLVATTSPSFGQVTYDNIDTGGSYNGPITMTTYNDSNSNCAQANAIFAGNGASPSAGHFGLIGHTGQGFTGIGCPTGGPEPADSLHLYESAGSMLFGLGSTTGTTMPGFIWNTQLLGANAAERMRLTSYGQLMLGTTTGKSLFTASSSTAPQLGLSDGLGNNQWTFRSIANSLFIATSTASATSTSAALAINPNGGILIPALANCNTIDSDATGLFVCGTDATGSGAWPFTPDSYNAVAAQSTTTNLWLKNAMVIASTTYFSAASTTVFTSSGNAWLNGKTLNGNGDIFSQTATLIVSTTTNTGQYTDVQSALNAIPSTGGVVHVRCGTYTLPTSNVGINIKTGGTILEGEGICTQFNFDKANTANAVGFNLQTGLPNVTLKNFYIHQTNATFGGIGLNASNTPLLIVQNIKIDGTATSTSIIDTTNVSFYSRYENLDLRDNTSCIELNGNPVNDNVFENIRCAMHSGNKGFALYMDSNNANGAQNNTFINFDSEPTGAATGLTAIYMNKAVDNTFIAPYIEGNATAYNITGNASRNQFVGGEFVTNTTYTNSGNFTQFLNTDVEGKQQNILGASTTIQDLGTADALVPALFITGNTNFAKTGDEIKIQLVNSSDSGNGVNVTNPGTGAGIRVNSTGTGSAASTSGTFIMNNLTAFALNDSAVCHRGTGQITLDAGVSSCIVSSRFVKHDIAGFPIDDAATRLAKLFPVTFTYNDGGKNDIGLIAEDVAQVDPRYAQYAATPRTMDGHDYKAGDPVAINWNAITADLVKVVQQLQSEKQAATRSVEENWQWAVMVLLFGLIGWQQIQIKRLKKVV